MDLSCVLKYQTAAAYSSHHFFIFFLSNFQTLKSFVTLFSGTNRPRRLKLGTNVDSELMYRLYRNQASAHNKSLTAKLLRQGYRYHKLRKTFSKFYRRHYELVSKFSVGLKTLLYQGLSEPEFYGDLIYKFK